MFENYEIDYVSKPVNHDNQFILHMLYPKRLRHCFKQHLSHLGCNVDFDNRITHFSLRLFLDCSYFSSIFQPSCSYKVCSYKKKRVLTKYVLMTGQSFLPWVQNLMY